FLTVSVGLVSAGRVIKKPKFEDGHQLQEATIQLLDLHQNLCSLFRELGNGHKQKEAASDANHRHVSGLLLGQRNGGAYLERRKLAANFCSTRPFLEELESWKSV
ncbi:hypothetical protein AMECASPLE_034456, partial [Ameca splendens]